MRWEMSRQRFRLLSIISSIFIFYNLKNLGESTGFAEKIMNSQFIIMNLCILRKVYLNLKDIGIKISLHYLELWLIILKE